MEHENIKEKIHALSTILKLVLLVCLLSAMISIMQTRTKEDIEYKYQKAVTAVTDNGYTLLNDNFIVDSDDFDITSDWKYAYKVMDIDDETKTVYLRKRKL